MGIYKKAIRFIRKVKCLLGFHEYNFYYSWTVVHKRKRNHICPTMLIKCKHCDKIDDKF